MIRLIRLVFLLFLLVVATGVSVAISNPRSIAAAPFRGIAIKTLELSSKAVSFFKDTRTVTATYERSLVSAALQAMIISEQMGEISPVTVSTNDMANFPSSTYPLYPEYFEQRYSEFRYTVSRPYEVILDKNDATVDPILAGILLAISQIKEAGQGLGISESK